MRTYLLVLLSVVVLNTSCSSVKNVAPKADCESGKIDEVDQCLIGKSLGQAIETLNLVRSRITEKAAEASMDCYRYQWGDRVIEFYCEAEKGQRTTVPSGADKSLEDDTESSRAILAKTVLAIRWSNNNGMNMHYAGNWNERRQRRM